MHSQTRALLLLAALELALLAVVVSAAFRRPRPELEALPTPTAETPADDPDEQTDDCGE